MAQQSEIPSATQGEENFVCLLEDNARQVLADLQPRLVVELEYGTAHRRSRADRLVYRQFDGAAQNFVTAREFKSFSPA